MSKRAIFCALVAILMVLQTLPCKFSYADATYKTASNENVETNKRHKKHPEGKKKKRCHGSKCNNDSEYSIQSYESLSFGKIVFPSHGVGTINIDPKTGDKTLKGGTFDLGGKSGPARFIIKANPGAQFEIVVPDRIRMRPKRQGVKINNMSVWPTGILRINPTGQQEFNVGGTMVLPSGVKPGNYRARFSVFINQIME